MVGKTRLQRLYTLSRVVKAEIRKRYRYMRRLHGGAYNYTGSPRKKNRNKAISTNTKASKDIPKQVGPVSVRDISTPDSSTLDDGSGQNN